MATIALPNGIVLDGAVGMAPTLQAHALRRGLSQIRVFAATHPNGMQNYLLVGGQTPIFESPQAEAIAAQIDMIHLDARLP